MKISILSNTNMDSLAKDLLKKYSLYKADGYNSWVQEILDKDSGLNRFNPDIVFIMLDGYQMINLQDSSEDIRKQMDQYFQYIEEYVRNNKAEKTNIFISDLDIPMKKIQSLKEPRQERLAESYWYNKLCTLCKEAKNTYIFDIKRLIENIGRREFYSSKLWYLGGMRYSLKGQKAFENNIDRYISSIEGNRKKCIALDLDNTLWGGVVGEDGLEGIEISDYKEGARYKDFQMRLKEIKDTGIMLAIVSKNNYEDAIEVFRKHKGMQLKEEDFVAMKINWEPKAWNIEELAQELNIGLDSIVFIDDNPVEREVVKNQLPQVIVPDFPEDSADLEDFIIKIYHDYFFSMSITAEDKRKTDMYKENSLRDIELKGASSIDDYLIKLQTRIKIWNAEEVDIERITQLTQKTNQFNLTTKRYTDKDIHNMIHSNEYDVYTASVEDKFGDNGKTVVLILKKDKDQKQIEIDTFLMSCRIMGRFIEDQVMTFVENKYKNQGFKFIEASYSKTNKNLPVANLFERLGYDLLEHDDVGNKRYRCGLDQITNSRKAFGELIEG